MMSVHGSLYDLGQDDYRGSPRSDFYLDLQQEKLKPHSKPGVTTSEALNLSLSTPDITTLLSDVAQQSSSITTQAPTTNSFLRAQVTEEQEMYAQGFLDALDQLHTTSPRPATTVILPGQTMPRQPAAGNYHMKGLSSGPVIHQHLPSPPVATGPNPTLEAVAPYVTATLDYIPNITSSQPEATTAFMRGNSTMNYATNTYTPFSMYSGSQAVDAFGGYTASAINSAAHIMGGPAIPSTQMRDLQSVVPADLHTQEQMKEERKKARNRLAASKCRVRRLQRESELQGKVKVLKEHNQELNSEVTDLRDQINNLKKALVQHMKGGCHVNFPEGYVLQPSE